MGDSIAKELMQLVQSLGTTLTVKMSHLFALLLRYKNAASLGAAASLAITLLWMWNFVKAPTNSRRSTNTPAASAIGGSPAPGSTSSASLAAQSVTHLQTQALQSCGSLSLAQMVRRRLQGGRKMTCQLVGVVLEETSPFELQQHAVVRPAAVEVLLEIARACELYLLARAEDDDSEIAVLAALEGVGAFKDGSMDRNKVLFCGSEAGVASFVRQLEPEWHVDTARERMQTLAPFVHRQLHITNPATSAATTAALIASNVFAAQSLEQFFGCTSSC